MSANLQIRLRPGLLTGPLAERAEPGLSIDLVAKRDLERYYDLLAAELRRVELSEAEASLICDACNGLMLLPGSYQYVWAEVADGIRLNGLDAKWQVDGAALVARLQAMSPGQLLAIGDAVERAWNLMSHGRPTGHALAMTELTRAGHSARMLPET